MVITANYGLPHLFKGIVKVGANSEAFKKNFDGNLEISKITGMNPIAVKGEYALNNYFSLGVSTAFWNIKLDVTDHYNAQRLAAGTVLTDSVDVYSFKISSSSFGVRPNLHIPIKSRSNDVYIGMGLGFTKNKLTIGFNSTDAGRVVKSFGRDLEYSLSLPGGVYFAPSLGYRHYFGENIGLNFEVGYEKGAILQAGLAVRFNTAK